MIAPTFPWLLNSGSKVRIFHILKGLDKYFDLTFVAPTIGNIQKIEERFLTENISAEIILVKISKIDRLFKKYKSLLSLNPYHVSYYSSNKVRQVVNNLIKTKNIDLIYSHFLYSMSYIALKMKIPIILDHHNVDREYWQRKASRVQNPLFRYYLLWNLYKTINYENNILNHILAYVSVSERDKDLTKEYASSSVHYFLTANNGVDIHYFCPKILKKIEEKKDIITLGFLGSMNLKSNEKAAIVLYRDIIPIVHAKLPKQKIRCLIIGQSPTYKIKNISKKDPAIIVTGTVPDIRPYLGKIDIFVAPLFEGAGSKLRILEAMSYGLPIIGSDIAFQGINGIHNFKNACKANNTKQFAEIIIKLIQKSDIRHLIGKNARNLVVNKYSWDTITTRLAKEIPSLL